MRFDYTPSRFTSPNLSWRQPGRMECALDSRYTHIVVPTRLAIDDCPVLRLGLEMAAMHRAMLTVLHVRPAAEQSPSAGGLHAISLLHRAVDRMHHRAEHDEDQTRLQVTAFLGRAVGDRLNGIDVRVECRTGPFADCIVRFATEKAADLVIVSAGVSRWWLPVLPVQVRRLVRRARQQVILVRPDRQRRDSIACEFPSISADR